MMKNRLWVAVTLLAAFASGVLLGDRVKALFSRNVAARVTALHVATPTLDPWVAEKYAALGLPNDLAKNPSEGVRNFCFGRKVRRPEVDATVAKEGHVHADAEHLLGYLAAGAPYLRDRTTYALGTAWDDPTHYGRKFVPYSRDYEMYTGAEHNRYVSVEEEWPAGEDHEFGQNDCFLGMKPEAPHGK